MHPKNVGIGIRCAYQSIDTHIRTPIDIPLQRVSYRALAGEGYFGMKSQTNLIPTNTSAGAKHSRCMEVGTTTVLVSRGLRTTSRIRLGHSFVFHVEHLLGEHGRRSLEISMALSRLTSGAKDVSGSNVG